METANERRRRKLIELCDRHGVRLVAERSNVNPETLTQIIKGVLLPAKNDGTRSTRNLGDAAAAAIERGMGLGVGWFDNADASLAERLAQLIDETGWDVDQLALIAEVEKAAAASWLDGTKTMSILQAALLASRSGLSATWLLNGRGQKRAIPPVEEAVLVDAGPIDLSTAVPIVGFAKMGEDGFFEFQEPEAPEGFVPYLKTSKKVYALRVRGTSMLPAISHGDVVVVNPDGKLVNRGRVAIALKDGRKMVKRLLSHKGGYLEVESVNGGKIELFGPDEVETAHRVVAVFDAGEVIDQ